MEARLTLSSVADSFAFSARAETLRIPYHFLDAPSRAPRIREAPDANIGSVSGEICRHQDRVIEAAR